MGKRDGAVYSSVFHTFFSHNRFQQMMFALETCVGTWTLFGGRGSAVGWGTALQIGRARVQFPRVSLEFFIDIILPAALWPWGWRSLQQKWVPEQMRPVRRADNLSTFMCRLSRNLGASTSWKPQILSRPVMGLLYRFFLPWTLFTICEDACEVVLHSKGNIS
jgi:hypothetical protein